MGSFINVSNHKSESWSKAQLEKAMEYGSITDIPFPDVDPLWSNEKIDEVVKKYFDIITSYDAPVAMVQGEFIFSFRLITRLKEAGIPVVAACAKRISEEHTAPDGSTVKTAKFVFGTFKEY